MSNLTTYGFLKFLLIIYWSILPIQLTIHWKFWQMYTLMKPSQSRYGRINTPKTFSNVLLRFIFPSLLASGSHWLVFCDCRLVCIFWSFIYCINGHSLYILYPFESGIFSLSVMIFRFIHVVCINSQFLLIALLLSSIPFCGYSIKFIRLII